LRKSLVLIVLLTLQRPADNTTRHFGLCRYWFMHGTVPCCCGVLYVDIGSRHSAVSSWCADAEIW